MDFRNMPELLSRLSPQLGSVPMILALSIGLSQLISNVPFVALYLPQCGSDVAQVQLMALAAGSTIAGNLLILGAASNVIIIQNAEKEGQTLSFFEFSKIGSHNYIFRCTHLFHIHFNL